MQQQRQTLQSIPRLPVELGVISTNEPSGVSVMWNDRLSQMLSNCFPHCHSNPVAVTLTQHSYPTFSLGNCELRNPTSPVALVATTSLRHVYIDWFEDVTWLSVRQGWMPFSWQVYYYLLQSTMWFKHNSCYFFMSHLSNNQNLKHMLPFGA